MRAESRSGQLRHETFAERLRSWGAEAKVIRQATRWRDRNYDTLWRLKARQEVGLRVPRSGFKATAAAQATREHAAEAWMGVGRAFACLATRPTETSRGPSLRL